MINELRGQKNDALGIPNYKFNKYQQKSPNRIVTIKVDNEVLDDGEQIKKYEKQYKLLNKEEKRRVFIQE